jgi:hypothetical protein
LHAEFENLYTMTRLPPKGQLQLPHNFKTTWNMLGMAHGGQSRVPFQSRWRCSPKRHVSDTWAKPHIFGQPPYDAAAPISIGVFFATGARHSVAQIRACNRFQLRSENLRARGPPFFFIIFKKSPNAHGNSTRRCLSQIGYGHI